MKAFSALFRRDMKRMGGVYAPVLLGWLALCASILWLFHMTDGKRMSYTDICFLLLFAAHPIIFSRTFTDDILTKSNQQWFFLPVRRLTVVVSRISAAMALFIISLAASFLWSFLIADIELHFLINRHVINGHYSSLIPIYRDLWKFYFYESHIYLSIKLFSICSFVFMGAIIFSQSLVYSCRISGFTRKMLPFALFFIFWTVGFDDNFLHMQWLMKGIFSGLTLIIAGFVIFDRHGSL